MLGKSVESDDGYYGALWRNMALYSCSGKLMLLDDGSKWAGLGYTTVVDGVDGRGSAIQFPEGSSAEAEPCDSDDSDDECEEPSAEAKASAWFYKEDFADQNIDWDAMTELNFDFDVKEIKPDSHSYWYAELNAQLDKGPDVTHSTAL